MALNADAIQKYTRFILQRSVRGKTAPVYLGCGCDSHREYTVAITEDKTRLLLRFGPIVTLLNEADFWAQKDYSGHVAPGYVSKALNEYRFRYKLF